MRSDFRQKADMLTHEAFLKHVRDALNHLHSADHLRQSPLAVLFDVAGRFDTALALRRALTDAIASLKPSDDEPSESRAWRAYDSLFCCYVQQLGQQAVADQLGVSVRQLRREQRAALEILADRLWEQYRPRTEPDEDAGTGDATSTQETSPPLSEELAWLKARPPEKPTDLNDALQNVLDLAQPLAAQHDVQLEVRTDEALADLAVHSVALSEMLLNLLSVAVPRSSGSQVTISARPLGWAVEVKVQGTRSSSTAPSAAHETACLQMASQLAGLCRCKLAISEDNGTFGATLTLPALEQLPVLVIDDNADTLQLLERYTSGTRYRLVSTQDPGEALQLAHESRPRVIVLDVMMPQVDGWKVLGWLRQNPLTQDLPILVCTVMPQETLALSLGASGFIRKPVTRQAFLAALDQQVALKGTESR